MLSPGQDRYGEYLPLSDWAGLPAYLRLAVLRAWLVATGDPVPGQRALATLAEQCRAAARDSNPCLSMSGVAWWRFRDRLYRVPAVPPIPGGYSRTWQPATPCRLPDGSTLTAEATEDGGAVPARGPLFIEYREGGERFHPVGRRHSQTLKRLLQEADVPPWVRPRLPLLYLGERLVAVADRWVSAEAATTPGEPGWRLRWHPPDA
jgi:tRNA(Ile)-lysidine synthase